MRARKRFGQHFLHDPGVLDRIVNAVSPRAGDHIVEIGPGRGALTHALLDAWPDIARTADAAERASTDTRTATAGHASHSSSVSSLLPARAAQPEPLATPPASAAPGRRATLDLIEIDRDLAPPLRAEFANNSRITVHESDALDFDFTALAAARDTARLRIIGNLPYNISTPLLFHLLGSANVIEDMHVMLQREVVDRIAASPGTGDYGRLTVMLAPWVKAESLFDVGPGAFQPPPRVWSSVVRLTVRREPAFAVSPHFAAVVAAAFSHRRKTIRNALRDLVTPEQIAACHVDLKARPDTNPPASFNDLARTLD
jgi:16S rRNA (adenine1518-N6/adenine1519-N6)-dimethyltransferase